MMASLKRKIEYAKALGFAMDLMVPLGRFFERLEIAGSLRRRKMEVGDIELVGILKPVKNLFGEVEYPEAHLVEWLRRERFGFRKSGPKYKQLVKDGFAVDLFLVRPETWGVLFMIRTGPSYFSTKAVMKVSSSGYLPNHLRVKDGRVWARNEALETPEERDFMDLLVCGWVDPEKRHLSLPPRLLRSFGEEREAQGKFDL